MCGRYALKADPKVLAMEFNVAQASVSDGVLASLEIPPTPVTALPTDAFTPNYNVAPTHHIAAVAAHTGGNVLAAFSWGLVPSWAKDPSMGTRMINARAETVTEKPSYRTAVAKRRCLVPADGWYEWQRTATSKQPYYFSYEDGSLLAFAAIYERWQSHDGKPLWSTSILTTEALPEMAYVHDRMPLLVPAHLRQTWLAPGPVPVDEFIEAGRAPGQLALWPVDKAVGNVRNNREALTDEVALGAADSGE